MSTTDGVDFDGTNLPRVANSSVNATDRAERHHTYETSTSDSLVRTESPARKRSRAGPKTYHSDDENRQDAILRLRLLRLMAVPRPDRLVAETARTRELAEFAFTLALQETGVNRVKLLQEIVESYAWYHPSERPPGFPADEEGNPSEEPPRGGTPVDYEPPTPQILRIVNANYTIIRLDGNRLIHGLRDEDFDAWFESYDGRRVFTELVFSTLYPQHESGRIRVFLCLPDDRSRISQQTEVIEDINAAIEAKARWQLATPSIDLHALGDPEGETLKEYRQQLVKRFSEGSTQALLAGRIPPKPHADIGRCSTLLDAHFALRPGYVPTNPDYATRANAGGGGTTSGGRPEGDRETRPTAATGKNTESFGLPAPRPGSRTETRTTHNLGPTGVYTRRDPVGR